MRHAGTVVAVALALSSSAVWAQQKSATPQEVVQKVHAAAVYLSKEGAGGLATFKKPQSDYVWADTYVFVSDCVQKKNAAHPILSKLIGMDLTAIKDPAGKVIGPMFCEDHGGKGYWVEYQWPKPGEEKAFRKLTYTEPVPGTPYSVSAGIYNDTASLAELAKMSGG